MGAIPYHGPPHPAHGGSSHQAPPHRWREDVPPSAGFLLVAHHAGRLQEVRPNLLRMPSKQRTSAWHLDGRHPATSPWPPPHLADGLHHWCWAQWRPLTPHPHPHRHFLQVLHPHPYQRPQKLHRRLHPCHQAFCLLWQPHLHPVRQWH